MRDHHLSGTHEQLNLILVGKIQIVDQLREDIPIELSIVETDKINHTVETDMMKLVVEIKCFGVNFDEFDKETRSSDKLQPKQAGLNYVHALNEPHFHEIHVVPNKHEADRYNSDYFFGLVTPFSTIEVQMSGPLTTDSMRLSSRRPFCLSFRTTHGLPSSSFAFPLPRHARLHILFQMGWTIVSIRPKG
ncbi:hypothetical protein Tco_0794474 [Tanacetum coccineum]